MEYKQGVTSGGDVPGGKCSTASGDLHIKRLTSAHSWKRRVRALFRGLPVGHALRQSGLPGQDFQAQRHFQHGICPPGWQAIVTDA